MSDRWGQIVRTPPVVDARWATLPENGWGAIVAYHAGPGRARPHDAPLELRTVTEVCTDVEGNTRRRTVPMTPEDLADIAETVNTDLDVVGLPSAPFTWWEVALPGRMTAEELIGRLERACFDRVTARTGIEVARQYAAVLADEVAAIFDRSDATD